jgi:hypothetical protein
MRYLYALAIIISISILGVQASLLALLTLVSGNLILDVFLPKDISSHGQVLSQE